MSVLQQYMIRKGFDDRMTERVRAAGHITIPPNWTNYYLEDEMMFSHRCNRYVDRQYTADGELHAHGYYELVINIRGEAEYIQNDRHFHPRSYTVVWCPPGNMHAVRFVPCEYERYLLYFSPDFFMRNGETDCPILNFTKNNDAFALQIDESRIPTLQALLERIEQTFLSDLPYKCILAKALIVELFAFFNTTDLDRYEFQNMNDPIAEVKKYIDKAYGDISGIDQIAAEFHYSREHLSRKFKRRFNTSISDYLARRRILESTRLLTQMGITEACYAVGFRNPSVYIAAFKKNMGCLPSEYKKQLTKE